MSKIIEFFKRINDKDVTVTQEGKDLLKMINLKHLSTDYAGYKSPAVFHQRVNGYILNRESNRKGYFSHATLIMFRDALGTLITQLNVVYKQVVEILEEFELELHEKTNS